ncbi:unnamed protein product [Calypogeia fissa]
MTIYRTVLQCRAEWRGGQLNCPSKDRQTDGGIDAVTDGWMNGQTLGGGEASIGRKGRNRRGGSILEEAWKRAIDLFAVYCCCRLLRKAVLVWSTFVSKEVILKDKEAKTN